MGLFFETLSGNSLDHYYNGLTGYGVTNIEQLTQLTMQDYSSIGIVSMDDRKIYKKRFQLIQKLKSSNNSAESSGYRDEPPIKTPQLTFIPKPSWSSKPTPILQPHNHSTLNNLNQVSDHLEKMEIENKPSFNSNKSNFGSTSFPNLFPTTNIDQPDLEQPPPQQTRPQKKVRSPPSTNPIQTEEYSFNHQQTNDYAKSSINNIYTHKKTVSTSQPVLNAYGIPVASTTASIGIQQKQKKLPDGDRIRVCVRKRPLSRKEVKRNECDVTTVIGRRTLVMNESKVKVDMTKFVEQSNFTFDEVFDVNCDNEEVYKRTAQPLVEYIFTGGKATCFAYGQTGSGKTHTMLDLNEGLYVLAGRDIFQQLLLPKNQHLTAQVSFYEIYQGHLYDLLQQRKKLYAREDGNKQVQISGLKEVEVGGVQDMVEVFELGSGTRSTGVTGANADSSRSHAIFQIVLKNKTGKQKVRGKFSFIDLAGSERGADRGESDRQTRMEGSEINKSLLALKECIRALDLDSKHTPFRQSKLTQVLKDSFIGNSKTCMIATISPNASNSEHSLNTLRYADRVKELKGESNLSQETEPTNSDEDANVVSDDLMLEDDDLLIDQEFPPDSLHNVEDDYVTSEYEDGYIDEREDSDLEETEVVVKQKPKTNYDFDDEKEVLIDEFVSFHRHTIAQLEDASKKEKALLVDFVSDTDTISAALKKKKSNTKQSKGRDFLLDRYLSGVEEILELKIAKLKKMKEQIKKFK